MLSGLSNGDLTTGTTKGAFTAAPCGRMGTAGAGLTCGFSGTFGPFFGPAPNGKITGTNFLFVMTSGVLLVLIGHLGVSSGSSVNVLSLSESISNESSVLS